MHQAILPGIHASLAGIRTPYFHCCTSAVLPQLLPPSLLGGLLHLLISSSNLLALGPHNLESFSPLQ